MILYLVCDTSGSMSEGGKHLITRGIALAVEQYFRFRQCKGEIKLISWDKEAQIVNWLPGDEYPPQMLECKGAANAKALVDLLGRQVDGKILLLTDGFWTRENEAEIKRWKRLLPQDALRIIKIGADANIHLKGDYVFSAEDVFAALDSWLEGDGA